MKKAAALANALRGAGAKISTEPPPLAATAEPSRAESAAAPRGAPAPQKSRIGTKPITLHLNEETRRQLKTLAAEQGRTVESMGAEAFNLLFVRYRKPEVAAAKGPRS